MSARRHGGSGTLRRALRLTSARIALGVVLLIAVLAVFGGALAPHDPLAQDTSAVLRGPSGGHWLGTDYLGRDVLSRLMAGTGRSVVGALEAVGIGLVLGVLPGLASLWLGRVFEWVSLRVVDAFMTLPYVVFAVAVTGFFGNSLIAAMTAVGVLIAPLYFRITRAAALGLTRTQDPATAPVVQDPADDRGDHGAGAGRRAADRLLARLPRARRAAAAADLGRAAQHGSRLPLPAAVGAALPRPADHARGRLAERARRRDPRHRGRHVGSDSGRRRRGPGH
jgi:hypothetical protein